MALNTPTIRKRLTDAGIELGPHIDVTAGQIVILVEDDYGQVCSSETDELFDKVRKVFPDCRANSYGSGAWCVSPNKPAIVSPAIDDDFNSPSSRHHY